MLLVSTLRTLFFLLFLFPLRLDPAELPEDLLPLLPRLSAACELHCKDLVHNLVEFRSARHAQSFQFVCHSRKADAKWPPLVQIGPDFRKDRGVIRFGHQIRHLLERELFEEAVSIDRSIHLPPRKLLLRLLRFLLKTEDSIRFRSPKPAFRENFDLFPVLQ